MSIAHKSWLGWARRFQRPVLWFAIVSAIFTGLIYLELLNRARLSHALVGVGLVALSLVFSGRSTTFVFAAVASLVSLFEVVRSRPDGGLDPQMSDSVLGLALVWVAAALVLQRKKNDSEREAFDQAARARQSAVVALATDPAVTAGDITSTAQRATEILAQNLGVARASIWFRSEDRSALSCIDLFEAPLQKHSAGMVLSSSDYPRYFAALESGRAIDAHDARTDPRTSEYTPEYLVPLGITSMLDAGIRVAGRNFGVVCCEHVGVAREWRADELAFAGEVADQIAQSVVNAESRRAHEAVQASERKYRNLVETSNDLIWAVDRVGRLTFVNRGPAEMMFGYSPEEMTGRTLADFQAKDPAVEARGILESVMRGESLFFYETVFLRKNGQPIALSFNALPLKDEQGEVIGATGTAADISGRLEAETRRSALEEQLRKARHLESLGRLAGGIAHDFNNILSAIMMNAELLRSASREGAGSAEAIVSAAQRGKELIAQILTYSRQVKPAKVRTDLGLLAREIEQLLGVTVPPNIRLSVNVSGHADVLADSSQMSQVLMNLCSNAIYAMRRTGGELRLEVATIPRDFVGADRIAKLPASANEVVMVRVSDTGNGIPLPLQEKIFEPFFSTKPVGEGTGLGLSVVLGIIESHGGQIHLDSTEGVGTVFEVYLPRAAEQSTAPDGVVPAPPVAQLRGGNEHIILVDDESMVLEVSAVALRQFGYRVSAYTEAQEVLEMIEKGTFSGDIIVTDLTMPQVTGLDLARKVAGAFPAVPVVLCSGYDLCAQDKDQEADVVSARLAKPYSIDELLGVVRQVLDARSPQLVGNE